MSPLHKAIEIKFKLDTEKASKVAVAIAAAYRLCRVSADTEYPQFAVSNAFTLIIITAILNDPHPAPKIKKSA